jgi:hypothetical protein
LTIATGLVVIAASDEELKIPPRRKNKQPIILFRNKHGDSFRILITPPTLLSKTKIFFDTKATRMEGLAIYFAGIDVPMAFLQELWSLKVWTKGCPHLFL